MRQFDRLKNARVIPPYQSKYTNTRDQFVCKTSAEFACVLTHTASQRPIAISSVCFDRGKTAKIRKIFFFSRTHDCCRADESSHSHSHDMTSHLPSHSRRRGAAVGTRRARASVGERVAASSSTMIRRCLIAREFSIYFSFSFGRRLLLLLLHRARNSINEFLLQLAVGSVGGVHSR